MTEPSAPTKSSPPIGETGFFFFATLAAGIVYIWMVSQARVVPSNSLMLAAGIVVISVAWSWAPTIVLGLTSIILFDIPGHVLGILPTFAPSLGLRELGVIASFLTYAALLYRFQAAREDARQNNSKPLDLSAATGDVLIAVAVAVVTVTVARWLLPFLYMGRTMGDSFHLHAGLLGFLVAAILIALASMAWPIAVGAIRRWGMNELEAEMIMNETAYQELRSDLAGIGRRLDREGMPFQPRNAPRE